MRGAEIYPSRSHYDIDDDVGRVEQKEEVNSSRDYDQLIKQDRIRRALSTVEQGREWPSQIGTRPSRFLKETDLCSFAIVVPRKYSYASASLDLQRRVLRTIMEHQANNS